MHFRCVFTLLKWLCVGRIGLGWAHDVFTIAFHMLMHFHPYVPYILYIFIYWLWLVLFCVSFSLSLSFFRLVALWHLNENLLRPGTLFVSGHPLLLILLPLIFGFVMIKPNRAFQRTFLDKAFIWNAKSFCQTPLTLTYPLSFTVGVGSHCVMSWSLVHPCLYMSSTPTCMDLIIQYHSLLLAFEVHASWSLWILYPTCSMSLG